MLDELSAQGLQIWQDEHQTLALAVFVNRKVDHLIAEKLTFFIFKPNL